MLSLAVYRYGCKELKRRRICFHQMLSPREHILKSLASKPQVLENCPVLGLRTALFLNRWNFVGKRQKPCGKSEKIFFLVFSSRDCLKKNFWRPFLPEKKFWRLFFEIAWKKILKTFFFENTCVCVLGPWPRKGLYLASKFFVPLALSLVSSTPPLNFIELFLRDVI